MESAIPTDISLSIRRQDMDIEDNTAKSTPILVLDNVAQSSLPLGSEKRATATQDPTLKTPLQLQNAEKQKQDECISSEVAGTLSKTLPSAEPKQGISQCQLLHLSEWPREQYERYLLQQYLIKQQQNQTGSGSMSSASEMKIAPEVMLLYLLQQKQLQQQLIQQQQQQQLWSIASAAAAAGTTTPSVVNQHTSFNMESNIIPQFERVIHRQPETNAFQLPLSHIEPCDGHMQEPLAAPLNVSSIPTLLNLQNAPQSTDSTLISSLWTPCISHQEPVHQLDIKGIIQKEVLESGSAEAPDTPAFYLNSPGKQKESQDQMMPPQKESQERIIPTKNIIIMQDQQHQPEQDVLAASSTPSTALLQDQVTVSADVGTLGCTPAIAILRKRKLEEDDVVPELQQQQQQQQQQKQQQQYQQYQQRVGNSSARLLEHLRRSQANTPITEQLKQMQQPVSITPSDLVPPSQASGRNIQPRFLGSRSGFPNDNSSLGQFYWPSSRIIDPSGTNLSGLNPIGYFDQTFPHWNMNRGFGSGGPPGWLGPDALTGPLTSTWGAESCLAEVQQQLSDERKLAQSWLRIQQQQLQQQYAALTGPFVTPYGLAGAQKGVCSYSQIPGVPWRFMNSDLLLQQQQQQQQQQQRKGVRGVNTDPVSTPGEFEREEEEEWDEEEEEEGEEEEFHGIKARKKHPVNIRSKYERGNDGKLPPRRNVNYGASGHEYCENDEEGGWWSSPVPLNSGKSGQGGCRGGILQPDLEEEAAGALLAISRSKKLSNNVDHQAASIRLLPSTFDHNRETQQQPRLRKGRRKGVLGSRQRFGDQLLQPTDNVYDYDKGMIDTGPSKNQQKQCIDNPLTGYSGSKGGPPSKRKPVLTNILEENTDKEKDALNDGGDDDVLGELAVSAESGSRAAKGERDPISPDNTLASTGLDVAQPQAIRLGGGDVVAEPLDQIHEFHGRSNEDHLTVDNSELLKGVPQGGNRGRPRTKGGRQPSSREQRSGSQAQVGVGHLGNGHGDHAALSSQPGLHRLAKNTIARTAIRAVFGSHQRFPVKCTLRLEVDGVMRPEVWKNCEFRQSADAMSVYLAGFPHSLVRGLLDLGLRRDVGKEGVKTHNVSRVKQEAASGSSNSSISNSDKGDPVTIVRILATPPAYMGISKTPPQSRGGKRVSPVRRPDLQPQQPQQHQWFQEGLNAASQQLQDGIEFTLPPIAAPDLEVEVDQYQQDQVKCHFQPQGLKQQYDTSLHASCQQPLPAMNKPQSLLSLAKLAKDSDYQASEAEDLPMNQDLLNVEASGIAESPYGANPPETAKYFPTAFMDQHQGQGLVPGVNTGISTPLVPEASTSELPH